MSEYTESKISFTLVEGIRYKLNEDLAWAIGAETGPIYVIPAGYVFDVSIPKWLHWLYSPHTRAFLKAAALHDHMLEAQWDRITAGAQFHQALKSDGVGRLRRLTMWAAVSLYYYS